MPLGWYQLSPRQRCAREPTLSSVLRDHLGEFDTEQPVVVETWPAYEHVNVQVGIDAWLAAPGLSSRLVGVVNYRHRSFGLVELLSTQDEPYDDHHGRATGERRTRQPRMRAGRPDTSLCAVRSVPRVRWRPSNSPALPGR